MIRMTLYKIEKLDNFAFAFSQEQLTVFDYNEISARNRYHKKMKLSAILICLQTRRKYAFKSSDKIKLKREVVVKLKFQNKTAQRRR